MLGGEKEHVIRDSVCSHPSVIRYHYGGVSCSLSLGSVSLVMFSISNMAL